MARAGLVSLEQEQSQDTTGTEAAILADSKLTEQEKQILVDIYRQFCNRN